MTGKIKVYNFIIDYSVLFSTEKKEPKKRLLLSKEAKTLTVGICQFFSLFDIFLNNRRLKSAVV